MKVIDTMTKRRIKRFESGALEKFQEVLDANLKPEFPEKMADAIKRLMLKTGSCLLISNKNTPPICRYGMYLIQEFRQENDIYFPLFSNVLTENSNPGDPMLFCIIAHSPEGLLFEWEYFYDRWRSGDIRIPHTTREDMYHVDSKLRLQLKEIRKKRDKEDADFEKESKAKEKAQKK